MPTPLELLLDPISISVFVLYGLIILYERLFPARKLPHSPLWQLRGLSAFLVFFFLSSYLPILWSETLLQWQLFDLTSFGQWGGALAGLLIYQAAMYFWHSSMHKSTFLWRHLHQMHHSAERLDSYSALWFSPFDMVGWIVLNSLCLTLIVGINVEATMVVLYATTFFSIFQHSNIRTPRWLGYIIQRPESHSYHHGRGVHANNYADLPMFDLMFGTFVNPKDFAPATGFYDGASLRVGDMLLARDITKPPQPTASEFIAN